MRRALVALLLGVTSVGVFGLPALADGGTSDPNPIALSYDFSDNDAPASASNGGFNVIVNVLPEHTGGQVRILAIAPDNLNDATMVCGFQEVKQDQVECSFNFPDPGVWTVKAQFRAAPKTDVSVTSFTRLRVSN